MIPYSDVFAFCIIAAMTVLLTGGPWLLLSTAEGRAPSLKFNALLASSVATAGVAGYVLAGAFDRPVASWQARELIAVIASTLAAVVVCDWRYYLIPDLFVVVLALSAAAWTFYGGPFAMTPVQGVLGALVCGGLLLLLWLGWRISTGAQGLGLGDVKLAGAIGGLLGWREGLIVIAGASTVGALVGALMRFKRSASDAPLHLPLGALLALSSLIILGWEIL